MLKSPNFIVRNLAYRCQYQTVSNMGKNVSLFQQKYCISDFNDTSNKAGADANVNSLYDEFVYTSEMCKEIINIRDGLLESAMSKVECNELLYYLTTVYKV